MNPSRAPRSIRFQVAVVGIAIAATAAVAALATGVLTTSTGTAAKPVAAYSPADGAAGRPVAVPVAVPTTPCAGSYWSTQAAGAAAPAVRPASAGGR